MSHRSIAGRTVLITGASSGIGAAAARSVAAKGATPLLIARRADALDAVVDGIRENGGHAYGYPCDITDQSQVDSVVADVLDAHGQVDMLVNNAGRSIRRSVSRSQSRLHDYERTMAVNYFGAVAMIFALLPGMRERRAGHIVNVSSIGVQAAAPRFSAYLASKAALDKFTEIAAAELIADRITFTTIHMPLVDTPMIAPSGRRNGVSPASPDWAAATIVRALVEQPRRIDTPRGTLAEYGGLIAPGIRERVMHAYYRAYPDSPAAKGFPDPAVADIDGLPTLPSPRIGGPARIVRAGRSAVRRTGRLVPGTSW